MARLTLRDIRDHLSRTIGSTSDTCTKEEYLGWVMEALPEVLASVRQEERAAIVAELNRLGEGRMDYVHVKVEHAGHIEAMAPMQAVIYGEAEGAKRLARIVSGELDDKGWLPSWRWSA